MCVYVCVSLRLTQASPATHQMEKFGEIVRAGFASVDREVCETFFGRVLVLADVVCFRQVNGEVQREAEPLGAGNGGSSVKEMRDSAPLTSAALQMGILSWTSMIGERSSGGVRGFFLAGGAIFV